MGYRLYLGSTMYGVFGSRSLSSYLPKQEPLAHQKDYDRLLQGLSDCQEQEHLNESR
jgi:hypothetical protein